jgi:dihydroorotate dehydrogenase (NAD+) catalytic subunit
MPPRKRVKVAAPRASRTTQAAETVNERINPLTVDLAITLGAEHPLRLERPIVVASGPLGFGNEVSGAIDLREVGLFVVRGISLRPRFGGLMPRLVEVPGGLMHAVNRENPGADEVMDRHGASWRSAPCAIAVSLVASSVKELSQLIARVERRADELGIAALEIDLTAPCDGLDGARWESSADESLRLIDTARGATDRPLIAKVSSTASELRRFSSESVDAGIDVLSVSGSPLGFLPDRARRGPAVSAGTGELSGPLVRPAALAAVAEAAGAGGAPIIGGGGIGSPADALDAFAAGASAVSLGTALWADPRLPGAVGDSLRRAVATRGETSLLALRGSALGSRDE